MPKSSHGKARKTSELKQISVIQHGPIMPGHDDEFDEERILIPPLPPSHLKGCNLIDVAYNVEVCGSGFFFFFFFFFR